MPLNDDYLKKTVDRAAQEIGNQPLDKWIGHVELILERLDQYADLEGKRKLYEAHLLNLEEAIAKRLHYGRW